MWSQKLGHSHVEKSGHGSYDTLIMKLGNECLTHRSMLRNDILLGLDIDLMQWEETVAIYVGGAIHRSCVAI